MPQITEEGRVVSHRPIFLPPSVFITQNRSHPREWGEIMAGLHALVLGKRGHNLSSGLNFATIVATTDGLGAFRSTTDTAAYDYLQQRFGIGGLTEEK